MRDCKHSRGNLDQNTNEKYPIVCKKSPNLSCILGDSKSEKQTAVVKCTRVRKPFVTLKWSLETVLVTKIRNYRSKSLARHVMFETWPFRATSTEWLA